MSIFKYFALFFVVIIGPLHAQIRPGDVILMPLHCYSCSVIEDETDGQYSHSGVVMEIDGELVAAESLGEVRYLTIRDFLKRIRPGKRAALYRPVEFESWDSKRLNHALVQNYFQRFAGLPFDPHYRWDNFNEAAQQLLYCSEFITKLLNTVLIDAIQPSPMDYSRNWDFWLRFFHGEVPQGEPGNSPSDFSKSKLFKFIQYL